MLSTSQLQELESVLNQFYGDATLSNDQRKQLEKWLNDRFHDSANAWRIGLELIKTNATTNCNIGTTTTGKTTISPQQLYMTWFGLHLIENAIKNHSVWQIQIPSNDKNQLKSALFQLITQHRAMHASVWTKICTLIVNIAKMEWPEQFPDFLSNVMQLCCQQDTIPVGLTMLLSVSEEFSTDRSDIPTTRRSQLKNHLLMEVNKIFDFLGQVLFTLWEQNGKMNQFKNAPQELTNIVLLLLKCTSHFLSWVPFEKHLKVEMLDILTVYATVPASETIRIQALTCFTEVLGKPFVATSAEPLMLKCFRQVCHILAMFVNANTPSTPSGVEDVDSDYLEKLALLQHFFIINHLRRIESTELAIQFLDLFHRFTFNHHLSTGQFLLCIESLSSFLEHLQNKKEGVDAPSFAGLIAQYSGIMIEFEKQILALCIFRPDTREEIFELDDVKVDSNDQTELDQFLNQCVEVVALIADLYFEKSLELMHQLFHAGTVQFKSLDKSIAIVHSLDSLSDKEKASFCVARNLVTTLRIYGQLNDKFVQNFDATLSVCSFFLSGAISIQMDLLGNMIHHKGKIFSLLSKEIFDCLQMFHPWMKAFSTKDHIRGEFEKLIVVIFDSFVKSLDPSTNATADILNGCTGLMLTIFYNFGSLPLTELSQYKIIMQNLPQLTQYLATKFPFEEFEPIVKRLYAALSNSILLKQMSNASALIEWQRQNYAQFTSCFLQDHFQKILVLLQNNQFNDVTILNTLPTIITIARSIVDSVHDKNKVTKAIVHENLKFLTDNLLNLFKVYIQSPHISNLLLGFMLSIFNSLSTQVGLDFIQQTVESFFDLFTQEAAQRFAADTNGRTVLISFLELLNALMSEGSSRFVSLTGRVVAVCQNVIFPAIMPNNSASYLSAKTSIDVLLRYSNLMHTILHSNWKYFFDMKQEPTNQQSLAQFIFIMHCFLQNFQLPDIDVFKETIKLIEQLNSSRKLYSRPIFIDQMMPTFLKVLFDVLVAKSHFIIQEDIILIIQNIASSSGSVFETNFLPNYLSSIRSNQNTALNQQQQVLLRQYFVNVDDRFSSKLDSFSNDVRYYLNGQTSMSA